MKDYQYPIDIDWTTEEMIIVVEMWTVLEQAYEKGVETQVFLETYKKFKQVIRSIGEEKKLGREFEELSGYSLYRAVQEAKGTKQKRFKMKG